MNFITRIGAALLALAAFGAGAQTSTFTRTVTTQNVASTGDCTAGSCAIFDMAGKGGASVEVRGTYTVSGGLLLRRSNSATNWETVTSNAFVPVGGTGVAAIASGATGTWQLGACVGFRWCMVSAEGAVTGTATIEGFTTNASVGGSTSVSGGAGDASAANQTTQITAEQAIQAGVGATADAAATAGSTGSLSAKLRLATSQFDNIYTALGTLNTSVNASTTQLPADGTGQVTMANSFPVVLASDQSAIALHGHGATGAAVPANVTAMGARAGANSVNVAQGSSTVAVNISTATTTQIVALSGSTQIYVTGITIVAGGTGNVTIVYGTGSACGTGTTSISGAMPLVANSGFALGSGLGPVIVLPAGRALCITTSAAVQVSGFITFTQF